jgi:phosphoenolpyruvate carboxykinase (GTP)
MHRLLRTGDAARVLCHDAGGFVRSVHCALSEADHAIACVFAESRTVWAVGLDAGQVLALRGHGLRLASVEARRSGWLPSPMSVMAVTPPSARTFHVGALFVGGCGQTHFAALDGRGGWRAELVCDAGAWLRTDGDGRLLALPIRCGAEASVAGLSPLGTPQLFAAARSGGLFVDATLGNDPAAHPRARAYFANAELPHQPPTQVNGAVALDAIVLGVRRSRAVPLVREAWGWESGAYMAAMLASEDDAEGSIELDPFGMGRWCALDGNEYAGRWLALGRELFPQPRIFQVNWYRRSADGRLLWPGHAENARVVEWIVDRLRGQATAHATSAGLVPKAKDVAIASGSPLGAEALAELLAVDPDEWRAEVAREAMVMEASGKGFPFELEREHIRFRTLVDEARGRGLPA